MEHSGGFYSPISRPHTPLPPTASAPTEITGPAAGDALLTSTPTATAPTTSDTTTTTAAQPPLSTVASPTLDQELQTVMKGIGSFWGKVRKQSVEVYQTANHQIDQYATSARKDLTPLVKQARGHLDQLSESTKAELSRLSEAGSNTSTTGAGFIIGADGMPIVMNDERDLKGKGVDRSAGPVVDAVHHHSKEDGTVVEPEPEPQAEPETITIVNEDGTISTVPKINNNSTPEIDLMSSPTASAAAFFTSLQSTLSSNPNVTSLSKNFSSLQSNLSTLPTSLQTNLNQLQSQLSHIDINSHLNLNEKTKSTAEGFLNKSENWFNEFTQEVAKLAKDAVKVVPPTGLGSAAEREKRERRREEGLKRAERSVVGRKEALILRLRNDKDILLVDPARPISLATTPANTTTVDGTTTEEKVVAGGGGEETGTATAIDTREEFARFLSQIEDKGGLEGEYFLGMIKKELEVAGGDGEENGLNKTSKEVVPSRITKEAFWSRYFFRVEQIEEDERRRKQVLEVAAGTEDDFSWDMEDEEDEEPTPAAAAATTTTTAPVTEKAVSAAPSLSSSTPAPSTPTPDHPTAASSTDEGDWASTPPSPTGPTAPHAPVITTAPTGTSMQKTGSESESSTKSKSSPSHPNAPWTQSGGGGATTAKSTSTASTSTSPRASSDGASSYDVVGRQSGNPSEVDPTDVGSGEGAHKKEEESDGEDSDWE